LHSIKVFEETNEKGVQKPVTNITYEKFLVQEFVNYFEKEREATIVLSNGNNATE